MTTIFEPVSASSVESRLTRDDRASGSAIVAGVVVAFVVLAWLGILGVGVGAWRPDLSPSVVPFTASAWMGVSALVASFVGGLAAGRLCGAATGNTARWHGLVSWCATAVLVMGFLAVASASLFGGVAAPVVADTTRVVSTTSALYGCGAMLVGALAAWLGGGLGAPAREEF